eukprot:scaffold2186_cov245-Pinguiococcus_pyrenoidosus.AAC.4
MASRKPSSAPAAISRSDLATERNSVRLRRYAALSSGRERPNTGSFCAIWVILSMLACSCTAVQSSRMQVLGLEH